MKRFIIFLSFLACFQLYAMDLQVVSTKYFDIVYDAEISTESAALLKEYADGYADEIFEKLMIKPFTKRMPVYIKAGVEELNAYYTSSPYNKIVLYDTSPIDGQLANQKDTLLRVFYHELTHAISLSSFAFLQPHGISEGVAVLFESMDGEGRLNDPRIKHRLMQDKIDAVSPTWSEAIEFRDTYPGGFWSYIYGAEFAKYLTDIYGMDIYASLWNKKINIFSRAEMSKRYGKTVDQLWRYFIQSIKIPNSIDQAKTLFNDEFMSIYSATATHTNGFAIFDANKEKILMFSSDSQKPQSINANKKVYAMDFSKNGMELAVSDIIVKNGKPRSRVIIYDFEKKRFTSENYLSLRYGCFTDDLSKICGIDIKSQFSNLVLIDRVSKNKTVLLEAGPGFGYSALYDVVNIGGDDFAVIAGNGTKRDILVVNGDTKEVKKLEFDQPMQAISGLRINKINGQPVISFSWTNDGMLTRMATYNVETGKASVLNRNINGGTFQPVYYYNKESNINSFIAVGMHGTYDKLTKIDALDLEDVKAKLSPLNVKKMASKSKTPNTELLQPKRYNPIMKMWVPSIMPYISLDKNFKNFAGHTYGISLSSKDVIDRLAYSLTVGIMPIPTFAHIDFEGTVNAGPTSNSVLVRENVVRNINNDQIHKTGFGFRNVTRLFTGIKDDSLSLSTEINCDWFAPITPGTKNLYKDKYTETLLTAGITVNYNNFIRKQRVGNYFFAEDISGLNITANTALGFNIQNKNIAAEVQTSVEYKTPIVPFTINVSGVFGYNSKYDPLNGSYNLSSGDTVLNAKSLLPTMNSYKQMPSAPIAKQMTGAFGFDTKIRIMSAEIQKASLWLPLAYNRFNIDLGYKGVLAYYDFAKPKEPIFMHAAYIDATIDISGSITVGINYTQPLIKSMEFGTVGLIFQMH